MFGGESTNKSRKSQRLNLLLADNQKRNLENAKAEHIFGGESTNKSRKM